MNPVPATITDSEGMSALARAELPTMTKIHDAAVWLNHQQLGAGEQPRGNCTLVMREGASVQAFVWADDAMYLDYDVVEPWWCINAIAVQPEDQGRGYGRVLIDSVERAARACGVQLLYGLTVPNAVEFWRRLGYRIAGADEGLRSLGAARIRSGALANLTLATVPPDRFFFKYLATEPGSVRAGLIPASWALGANGSTATGT